MKDTLSEEGKGRGRGNNVGRWLRGEGGVSTGG